MKKFSLTALILGFILISSLVFSSAPVQAQEGVVWSTDIYNNQFLADPPAVNRQDSAINFNWGEGSPAEGIDPDRFSIRFGTDAYFTAGTYRFTVRADDSAQLWIDYERVIDTIGNAQPGQVLTVDVPLTEGSHHIQLDYREITGLAYVSLTWADVNTIPLPPVPDPSPINYGVWNAEYYANTNLFGNPTVFVFERTPTHNWGYDAPQAGIPADNFSARWTNTFYLTQGLYRLQVRTDDGVRVYIDNIPYIDEWHPASGQTYTRNIELGTGNHTVTVEYYEGVLLAFLDFDFRRLNTIPPAGEVGTPVATVEAAVLNVRDYPGVTFGDIITKVRRGETYPILARTSDGAWWRISVGGQEGWVSSRWVTSDSLSGVPIEDPTESLFG
jgi:hypothetical protein